MKKLLLLAVFAASVSTASAQTPRVREGSHSATNQAAQRTSASPAAKPNTQVPNYSHGNGQRTGYKKINTAPATGATRASRSSSTTKAAKQGTGTGSSNIETMSRNTTARPTGKPSGNQ